MNDSCIYFNCMCRNVFFCECHYSSTLVLQKQRNLISCILQSFHAQILWYSLKIHAYFPLQPYVGTLRYTFTCQLVYIAIFFKTEFSVKFSKDFLFKWSGDS